MHRYERPVISRAAAPGRRARTVLLAITVCALALSLACSEDPAAPPVIDTEATRDFEAAWNAAKTWYPLFGFKGIDWNDIHERYRPRAEATESAEGIYGLLNDLLGELKDAHAYYEAPLATPTYPFLPRRMDRDHGLFDIDLVQAYFSQELGIGGYGRARYGKTDDNIGYMHYSTLALSGMMGDFNLIMDYVQSTDGLIVDLRECMGGNALNVSIVISRFTETQLESYEMYTATGPVDMPPYRSDSNSYIYTNPVVVLINGAVFSGPEVLSEMLKRLPHVTLLGDTTAGAGCWDAGGLSGTVTLPSRRVIYVPTAYAVRDDGQTLEWNGIPPDIYVQHTAIDRTAGVDKQIEAAIDLLKQQ